MSYNIIALIGKAGTGKDTILKEVMKAYPERYHKIVNYTTRPKREYEVEGEDYFFVSREEFLNKVLDGEMITSACFNDWYYGVGYESLVEERFNIGVFSIDSLKELLQNTDDVKIFIFNVVANDKVRMLRQLNREERPNVDEIVRRYATDKLDFAKMDFNAFALENNNEKDLKRAVQRISDYF